MAPQSHSRGCAAMMRWPWQPKPETRQSGGGYTDAIVSALEARASASMVADVSSNGRHRGRCGGAVARVHVCRGAGAGHGCKRPYRPTWLAQVGRSLIREGASLSCDCHGPGDGEVGACAGRVLELRKY